MIQNNVTATTKPAFETHYTAPDRLDAYDLWSMVDRFNTDTVVFQTCLELLLAIFIFLSYRGILPGCGRFMVGITHLFLAFCFFGMYGTEPSHLSICLPLSVICGALFIYESIQKRKEIPATPNSVQSFLYLLYLLYPASSLLLNHHFPKIITYIMPCPMISLSIVMYSGFQSLNLFLLSILSILGLTGITAFFRKTYEDLIMFACGIYGTYLLSTEIRHRMYVEGT